MYSIHGLCACAALSIAAAFATSDANAAPLPIIAKHSHKCLDITGGPGATEDGVFAEQWECTWATNQLWTLQNDGFGRFQIIAEHSHLCLAAATGNEDARVFQTACNATENKQLWVKEVAGASNEFRFRQVSGGRCFAVAEGPMVGDDGQPIELQDCTTNPTTDNQIWTLGRNPIYWPFISSSIWNTPIGSGAQYVAAGLPAAPDDPNDKFPDGTAIDVGWSPMPQIDAERIVLVPTAPPTTINYSSAGWTGADRCIATTPPSPNFTGLPKTNVPIPSNYVYDPTSPKNDGAAFLLADGHTLVQTEPWARCQAGGSSTSIIRILDDGTNANTNSGSDADIISGNGRKGAHGGSMLGTLGGTIRLGEMRPGSKGPRHALKINLFSKMELFNCSQPNGSDCFRWPAYTADSSASTSYGSIGNNTNSAMKMGALLAIPPSVNINNLDLWSEPGRQLAWTLQNYGAYVVDSMGAAFAISAEDGFHGSKPAEFLADYGMDMEARVGHGHNSNWSHDLQIIRPLLQVVNNNGPNSVGGGGTPRQPLAPPFQ
jgi:hypothetical protein